MKNNKPFNFPFEYEIKEKKRHPTLMPTIKTQILVVPEFAKDYVIDFFYKVGILAVLAKHEKIFIEYGIRPRYVIKTKKER